ncbi:OprO/OprP family phosphate-selective porin [Verrucomicrobiales bacterium]|nr:OprO/OprP family phosphate-selective porin [Verrucomicrobiales bacterium]
MIKQNALKKLATLACTGLLSAQLVTAGDGKLIIDDKNPMAEAFSPCDIFDKNTLYESDNGFIRKVKLKGRYHGQYISQTEDIDDVRDNGYHNLQHRRARIQMDFDLAHDLSFGFDANYSDGDGSSTGLVDGGDTFINNFQTINLQWKPSDDFYVIIGKDKQDITREDIQSSRFIKTVERAPIVNEVGQQRPWGAQVGFLINGIEQRFGAWVYGAHDSGPEWVDFRANKGASYNLTVPVNENLDFHFDWNFVNNDGGRERARGDAEVGTFGSAYEHAFAWGVDYEKDRFKLISDFIYGANRESSGAYRGSGEIPTGDDTWGFYVLPSYKITDRLEGVFRYQYMDSGREQRTQRFGNDGGGDNNARFNVENYHSVYAGFQYFLCGENLKLMGGYEYAWGDLFGTNTEIATGSWQFAVRTYF